MTKTFPLFLFLSLFVGISACSKDADVLEAESDEKSCLDGDMSACSRTSLNYFIGLHGVKKDLGKSAAFSKKACDGGLLSECDVLGTQYARGEGVKKDLVEAGLLFKKACDAGFAPGCKHLGLAHRDGSGVAKDQTKAESFFKAALILYQKACDGGDNMNCDWLGNAYRDGEIAPKDLEKSTRLYEKACKAGYKLACHHLKSSTQ